MAAKLIPLPACDKEARSGRLGLFRVYVFFRTSLSRKYFSSSVKIIFLRYSKSVFSKRNDFPSYNNFKIVAFFSLSIVHNFSGANRYKKVLMAKA